MTAHHYELDQGASLLDRFTLRVFRCWRGSGRDFVRAYLLTQLVIAALLVVPLVSGPGLGTWQSVGAVAAVVAPIAAWILHRRRHGWRAQAVNLRAQRWGIGLGIVLFLFTGVVVALLLSYIGIAISMLSPGGPAVLLPAVGTGAIGWLAAAWRKRQIDNPIYP